MLNYPPKVKAGELGFRPGLLVDLEVCCIIRAAKGQKKITPSDPIPRGG
jgi:hypothetical protein